MSLFGYSAICWILERQEKDVKVNDRLEPLAVVALNDETDEPNVD